MAVYDYVNMQTSYLQKRICCMILYFSSETYFNNHSTNFKLSFTGTIVENGAYSMLYTKGFNFYDFILHNVSGSYGNVNLKYLTGVKGAIGQFLSL